MQVYLYIHIFSLVLVLCWRRPLDIGPKYSQNWFPLSWKDFSYCFYFVFVCYGKTVWPSSLFTVIIFASIDESEQNTYWTFGWWVMLSLYFAVFFLFWIFCRLGLIDTYEGYKGNFNAKFFIRANFKLEPSFPTAETFGISKYSSDGFVTCRLLEVQKGVNRLLIIPFSIFFILFIFTCFFPWFQN